MNALFEHLPNWLTHPALIRWGEALLGLVLILFVFGVMRGLLAKRITVPETRYLTRKMITFISYFAAAIYIAGLFSDSLGQLTVVFGVVGESIAFALQEVIASFAGWVAISIGQFYRPGDHVLLGASWGIAPPGRCRRQDTGLFGVPDFFLSNSHREPDPARPLARTIRPSLWLITVRDHVQNFSYA
jgi:small-conductance mechanosensitive channel